MKSKFISYTVFVSCVLFLVLYHFFIGYTGLNGYDDYFYAQYAYDLTQGKIDLEDHFSHRFPVLILAGLCFSLLGVTDFSTALSALIMATLILGLVFYILRKQGWLTITLALVLTTLSPYLVYYSDKLMSDLHIVLYVFAALASLHQYKFDSTRSRTAIYAFSFAFFLLLGFLTKGVIVLLIPLLLYLFIVDVVLKRDLKFWWYASIFGGILLLLYFGIMYGVTGSPFQRFEAIAENSYLNPCSYDEQPLSVLWNRISHQFFAMSISHGLMTTYVFLLAAAFRKSFLSYFKCSDSFSFWLVSAIILLLSSNFMTISASSYSPLCLDVRHYLFLVPISAIPAAQVITSFLETRQLKWGILCVSLVLTGICFFFLKDSFFSLFLPLTIWCGLMFFLKKRWRITVSLVVLPLILLYNLRGMAEVAIAHNHRKQAQIFKDYVLNRKDECVVITNKIQARQGHWYQSFQDSSRISFVSFEDFRIDTTDKRTHLLVLNPATESLSSLAYSDLPFYARHIPDSNPLLIKDDALDMSIYEMKTFSQMPTQKTSIVHSLNDFEALYPHWSNKDKERSDIAYQGKYGHTVLDYSTTFQYPLDSIILDSNHYWSLSCELQIRAETPPNATIFVSVEDASGIYIWEGKSLEEHIKTYSTWWNIHFFTTHPVSSIKKGSILKVSIMKHNDAKLYIDDFDVKLDVLE